MITELLPGALALLTVLAVLLGISRRAATRQTRAIPSSLIGRLPTGTNTINELGYQLILQAVALVAEAIVLDELEASVDSQAQSWLARANRTDSERGFAMLIQQAGALMIRIQTSDDTYSRLDPGRRKKIDAWIAKFSTP